MASLAKRKGGPGNENINGSTTAGSETVSNKNCVSSQMGHCRTVPVGIDAVRTMRERYCSKSRIFEDEALAKAEISTKVERRNVIEFVGKY